MVYSLWYFRFSLNLRDEVKCLYVVLFRHITALFDVKSLLDFYLLRDILKSNGMLLTILILFI